MQPYPLDNLFGDRLTHIIYSVLLKSEAALNAREISTTILKENNITMDQVTYNHFLIRVRRRLIKMVQVNEGVHCFKRLSSTKIIINYYQITIK